MDPNKRTKQSILKSRSLTSFISIQFCTQKLETLLTKISWQKSYVTRTRTTSNYRTFIVVFHSILIGWKLVSSVLPSAVRLRSPESSFESRHLCGGMQVSPFVVYICFHCLNICSRDGYFELNVKRYYGLILVDNELLLFVFVFSQSWN